MVTLDTTSREKSSPTYYKDNINPRSYSFQETTKWTYTDSPPGFCLPEDDREWNNYVFQRVENFMYPTTFFSRHLVLQDEMIVPRLALAYSISPELVNIGPIQRLRTQYDTVDVVVHEKWRWNAERETVHSREFREKLEKHPTEFLLSEFLHRYQREVRNALPEVFLCCGRFTEASFKVYRGLIDRFCEREGVLGKGFRLNVKKERVRVLLGID